MIHPSYLFNWCILPTRLKATAVGERCQRLPGPKEFVVGYKSSCQRKERCFSGWDPSSRECWQKRGRANWSGKLRRPGKAKLGGESIPSGKKIEARGKR